MQISLLHISITTIILQAIVQAFPIPPPLAAGLHVVHATIPGQDMVKSPPKADDITPQVSGLTYQEVEAIYKQKVADSDNAVEAMKHQEVEFNKADRDFLEANGCCQKHEKKRPHWLLRCIPRVHRKWKAKLHKLQEKDWAAFSNWSHAFALRGSLRKEADCAHNAMIAAEEELNQEPAPPYSDP